MKQIFAALLAAIAQFKAKANESISKLPPIEQFEANSAIGYGLRSLQSESEWLMKRAEEVETQLQAAEAQIAEQVKTDVEAGVTAAVDAKVEAGELVREPDVEAAVEVAVNAVRAEIKLLAERRAELTAKPEGGEALLCAEIAALIPDAVLLAEDYKAKAQVLASRVGEFVKVGIKTPKLQASALEFPLDEAGGAGFMSRLETIKEAAGVAGGGRQVVTAPFQAAAASGASDGDDIIAF